MTSFPFSPPWWQCCLSLPDEADKVLVGRESGMLFDYERGGRGHREFRTVIEPVPPEGAEFCGQELLDPKVPVVKSRWTTAEIDFVTEVFAACPLDGQFTLLPVAEREGGEEATAGWDGPKIPRVKRDFFQAEGEWGPEFRTAAWSSEDIVYAFRVPCGAERSVAIGLGEGEHMEAGRRILRIAADGARPLVIDPVAAFGAGKAGLCRVQARDADGDGILRVRVSAAPESPDRAAFVNAMWLFDGPMPPEDEIFSGRALAAEFVDCGRPALPRRRFLMRLAIKNRTSHPVRFVPSLRVRTLERVRCAGHELEVGHATRVIGGTDFQARSDGTVALSMVEVPPSGETEIVLAFDRNGYQGSAVDSVGFDEARRTAISHWGSLDLPYGKIVIPDDRIQSLIDSSIRNIYQARDIERGLPAFHVGPTCYRQLWVVDGAFLLELVAMLGRPEEARAGISYLLGFQEDDGGFQLKARYWKETGIVLWALVRQAVLTGDVDWLRSHWSRIERAVDFIRRLRTNGRAADPEAPEFGLVPYGDIDGGISNMEENERLPEYSNTYWLLIGLKAACEAGRLLGKDVRQWADQYERFLAVFHAAARRDMTTDARGNRYLPIRMGATDTPQKAQWAFCHAVHPGKLFPTGDPFVEEMLAMLDAARVEGLVLDTGWMQDGLWTYFASFLGHAHLWQGHPHAALAQLEAFADHAAPVLVWREEQKPAGSGNDEVGDMPHNWASAEFVRLAVHLVALERGDELHLFPGIPPSWVHPGAAIALRGIHTAFGPLTATIDVSATEIQIVVEPLERPCRQIVIHTSAWGGTEPQIFPADRKIALQFAMGTRLRTR